MRYCAPRIGRPRRHNTMVDQQTVGSELGQASHPKEFVVDGNARGETAGSPSQKLPSTAIYCHFVAAKSLRPFQPAVRPDSVGTPVTVACYCRLVPRGLC